MFFKKMTAFHQEIIKILEIYQSLSMVAASLTNGTLEHSFSPMHYCFAIPSDTPFMIENM